MHIFLKQLIIGLFCISYTNFSDPNGSDYQQLLYDTIPILSDTMTISSELTQAKPNVFETAYFKGTTIQINDTISLTFFPVDIGKIDLPSGKVVACDPAMSYQQEAFTTQFPTGQFPVQLAIAKVNEDKNQLVGFSRIKFSDEPVLRWEFALKKGQQPISLFGTSWYYYPVDGGLGHFIDENSFNKMEKMDEATRSDILNNLFEQLDKHTIQSWQFANTNYKGFNIVAFTSGLGDGRYATYIGFDKNGNPCRLLTDFGLVNWLD